METRRDNAAAWQVSSRIVSKGLGISGESGKRSPAVNGHAGEGMPRSIEHGGSAKRRREGDRARRNAGLFREPVGTNRASGDRWSDRFRIL